MEQDVHRCIKPIGQLYPATIIHRHEGEEGIGRANRAGETATGHQQAIV
jgi:hypothetical protein